MKSFLAALALVMCIGGMVAAEEPIDEPIRDTGDVFGDFWYNVLKQPFRDWGTGETTWDQMMRSVELGGYLRFRYETTEVRSIQRIFGPSPTGPVPNLGMVGDSWGNWIAYKAMFTTTFTLTDDITFYGSLINMNVISKEDILAAHADPSKYPDLVVRVTGYSAYFKTLSPEYRQQVVDRILAED